jgi:hypothetical protein
MALIAVHAVVHVTAPPRMSRIHLCLRVTCRACEDRVIGWIGVTIAARSRTSTMVGPKPRVLKRRSQP